MCEVVSKHCLKNPLLYKNALFTNMCTFLSHCFETKNYPWTGRLTRHVYIVFFFTGGNFNGRLRGRPLNRRGRS